jgi:hypothetical protein
MRWRVFVWLVRIAALATVLYGLWCGVAHLAGRHYFRRGMRHFS